MLRTFKLLIAWLIEVASASQQRFAAWFEFEIPSRGKLLFKSLEIDSAPLTELLKAYALSTQLAK